MTRARDLASSTENIVTSGLYTAQHSTSSSTYQPTGLTVTINKRQPNSKIVVNGDIAAGIYISVAATNGMIDVRLTETTSGRAKDFKCVSRVYGTNGGVATINRAALSWIDTQSGTGTRTYRVDFRLNTGTSAEINGFNTIDFTSELIAYEVL